MDINDFYNEMSTKMKYEKGNRFSTIYEGRSQARNIFESS